MFPSTTHRVPHSTAERINARIYQQTEERVSQYTGAGPRGYASPRSADQTAGPFC